MVFLSPFYKAIFLIILFKISHSKDQLESLQFFQNFQVYGCGRDQESTAIMSHIKVEDLHDCQWMTVTSRSRIIFSCQKMSPFENVHIIPLKERERKAEEPMEAKTKMELFTYAINFEISSNDAVNNNSAPDLAAVNQTTGTFPSNLTAVNQTGNVLADLMGVNQTGSVRLVKMEKIGLSENFEVIANKFYRENITLKCDQNDTFILENGFGFLYCKAKTPTEKFKEVFNQWKSFVAPVTEKQKKTKTRTLILSLVGSLTGLMLFCFVCCFCARLKKSDGKGAYRGRRRSSTSTSCRTREVEI